MYSRKTVWQRRTSSYQDQHAPKGLTLGVLGVVAHHDGDNFRAVCTARFETAVHVLHAFHKKARYGIASLKQELDLVRRRPALP